MNRKLCILFVGDSAESQRVLNALSSPVDLLSITGTTVLEITSDSDYAFLENTFGLQSVPCLVVMYRGDAQPQAFASADLVLEWYFRLCGPLLGSQPKPTARSEPQDGPGRVTINGAPQIVNANKVLNITQPPKYDNSGMKTAVHINNKPSIISVQDVLAQHKIGSTEPMPEPSVAPALQPASDTTNPKPIVRKRGKKSKLGP